MPRRKHIEFSELQQYFHLPIQEVAKQLQVCSTLLKKICRQNGIARWPHRKVKCLDKWLHTLQESGHMMDADRMKEQMEDLLEQKDRVLENPNTAVKIASNLKKRALTLRSMDRSAAAAAAAASGFPLSGTPTPTDASSALSPLADGASVAATSQASEMMSTGGLSDSFSLGSAGLPPRRGRSYTTPAAPPSFDMKLCDDAVMSATPGQPSGSEATAAAARATGSAGVHRVKSPHSLSPPPEMIGRRQRSRTVESLAEAAAAAALPPPAASVEVDCASCGAPTSTGMTFSPTPMMTSPMAAPLVGAGMAVPTPSAAPFGASGGSSGGGIGAGPGAGPGLPLAPPMALGAPPPMPPFGSGGGGGGGGGGVAGASPFSGAFVPVAPPHWDAVPGGRPAAQRKSWPPPADMPAPLPFLWPTPAPAPPLPDDARGRSHTWAPMPFVPADGGAGAAGTGSGAAPTTTVRNPLFGRTRTASVVSDRSAAQAYALPSVSALLHEPMQEEAKEVRYNPLVLLGMAPRLSAPYRPQPPPPATAIAGPPAFGGRMDDAQSGTDVTSALQALVLLKHGR